MEAKLSHVDKKGDPGMVDVSQKKMTARIAKASGRVIAPADVMHTLSKSGFDTKKGSIVQTAIIAATMAVKNTYNTIPLCHQIPITSCKVLIDTHSEGFDIVCMVKTVGQTGVEMEALHGVSTAALTIYDMCKALSHDIQITEIRLDHKSGGKSEYNR